MDSILVIATIILVNGVAGLQWTDTLGTTEVLYACVGSDADLSWEYQLQPRESVFSITWQFSGRTQEMMAMSSHGAFVPLPAYSHRVTQSSNAGLRLSQVILEDSGRYWVEINGQDAAGAFTVNRTIQLQVADNLLTTDNHVHVTQSPSAVHDDVTDTWHLQLNCGTFSYLGHPPFEVQWLSPSGARYNSTGFRDGQFQLLVPNPVEEGGYTCLVPASATLACLPHGQSVSSQFHTDGVLVRLTLLEAEQASVRQQNQDLYAELQQLQGQEANSSQRLEALQASVEAQQRTLEATQQCCADNQAALAALQTNVQALAQRQQGEQTAVQALLRNFTDHLQQLQLHGAGSPKVAFHAKLGLDSSRHSLAVVSTYSNYGNGLTPSSVFVAPVAGTYFFVASAGDRNAIEGGASPTFYLPLQITKENTKVAEGLELVHAVMDLLQGQHVQVLPVAGAQTTTLLQHPDLVAYFSGFLLHQ